LHGDVVVLSAKDALLEGAEILGRILFPNGFKFRFGGEENGSGGKSAWGEFVRKDRRLELHFRRGLGLVRYHIRRWNASHESYMRELEAWPQCRYPGFSEDAIDAFHELAHDLNFAEDFITGRAARLKQAAAMEKISAESRKAQFMAGYVGDTRKREQLRSSFREKRYGDVVNLARALKYPNLMTESERKMVEIAGRKAKTL
jgi:hypothetical protein